MHAKPDLRVRINNEIIRSGSVIVTVILLKREQLKRAIWPTLIILTVAWCLLSSVWIQCLPGLEIPVSWGTFLDYGWPFPAIETGPKDIDIYWSYLALNAFLCSLPMLATVAYAARILRNPTFRKFAISGLFRFTLFTVFVLLFWESKDFLYSMVLHNVESHPPNAFIHWTDHSPPIYLLASVWLGIIICFEWIWIAIKTATKHLLSLKIAE